MAPLPGSQKKLLQSFDSHTKRKLSYLLEHFSFLISLQAVGKEKRLSWRPITLEADIGKIDSEAGKTKRNVGINKHFSGQQFFFRY
jgi:hypothetical protein